MGARTQQPQLGLTEWPGIECSLFFAKCMSNLTEFGSGSRTDYYFPTQRNTMRPRTLSIPLTAAILTVALLAFEPVAFGQAGNPGGDTVSKELSLGLGQGVSMKLVLIPAVTNSNSKT
jgi:hypothetical protein